MSKFTAIFTIAKNRVIGDSKVKSLPWDFSENMKFFENNTQDCHIILGNKAFEKIGCLSKRTTWVFTKENKNGWHQIFNKDGSMSVNIVTDIKDLPSQFNYHVIGGVEILSLFMPQISEAYVTELQTDYSGDILMPEFENLFDKKEVLNENKDLKILKYSERKNAIK